MNNRPRIDKFNIKARLINILFNNILKSSTVCGIALFLCKVYNPHNFETLSEIVATYLIAKKG